MSATRDPSEKITFLYTPMTKVVRTIRDVQVPAAPTPSRSRVLKTEDLRTRKAGAAREVVREYRAPAITPAPITQALFQADVSLRRSREGVAALQQSLGQLEDLQKRFRFLLQELEELIQD